MLLTACLLQVLVQGFQAMNANNIAMGTQEMQLPVLPDPAMNLKLTQQQQQQQLPQQVPVTKLLPDVESDSNLVQAGAEKVQHIAEGVADSVSNVAGTQASL